MYTFCTSLCGQHPLLEKTHIIHVDVLCISRRHPPTPWPQQRVSLYSNSGLRFAVVDDSHRPQSVSSFRSPVGSPNSNLAFFGSEFNADEL